MIEVWRNGPVENMHASRRGPSDAAMFAESTALHQEAVKALTARKRGYGLLDFERHLLDRERPWAGAGGRTLTDLGYGFLGDYKQHVKARANALLDLNRHTCVHDPLEVYLIPKAIMYGRRHMGMPGWPTIVERIRILLSHPEHRAWGEAGRGAQAVAEMPSGQSIDELASTLLTQPDTLPVEVLEWLSDHLLYCAAPPYTWCDTAD
ncbi:hypothetical protein GCM10009754_00500 [Amycolatopsis minnesotensis]|uniref:Uncharacterized protein n=1 Tax=Amycolatopsis minnesotensis TaxID=337894 RepID=A0ABN2PX37_9PSEU